jgi:hypothetical protein
MEFPAERAIIGLRCRAVAMTKITGLAWHLQFARIVRTYAGKLDAGGSPDRKWHG